MASGAVSDESGAVGSQGPTDEATPQELPAADLREREERLGSVFDSIDQGFCLCEVVVDDDGRPVDYRFIEVNPHFEEMTGIVDAAGRTAYELIPDLEPHWLETYARVGLERETLRFESGSEVMGRWFDVFATPVGGHREFALVFTDVTARRRAEEALRASEERFRRLADSMPAMLWVTEVDGSCSYLSKAWYDFTGQAAEEGLGLGWLDATHPDDRARTEAVFSGANDARRGFRVEYRLRRYDGSYRWALDTAAPRFDLDGTFQGMVGTVIDITERKEAEEELRRRQADEHHVALRLQRALLPDALADHPHVGLAARYEAASQQMEVGGDWYDSFVLGDGRIGVAVGDVVGHGLEAAAAMGRLRAALNALAATVDRPGELLAALDRFASGTGGTSFATACCAVLDPATGEVDYASAGHPPMLVVDADGTTTWLEGGRSMPLCVGAPPDRPEGRFVLEPGSAVLLYSDGLVERRGEHFSAGIARLEAVARQLHDEPIDAMCEQLVDELDDGSGYEDDVVVLGMRFVPAVVEGFHRVVAARPEELAPLRAEVRTWLGSTGVPDRDRDDVLLAVGEACSNAVEHAHSDPSAGRIEVGLQRRESAVTVRVSDDGTWRPMHHDDGTRGRGTAIMRAIAEVFDRRTGSNGTTVLLTIPLQEGGGHG